MQVYECFHFPIHPSMEFNLQPQRGGRRNYPQRPHTRLAPRKQPNFPSIYAAAMTPLISRGPAVVPGSSLFADQQRLKGSTP